MCMLSVVTDYGRGIPPQQWNQPNWDRFKEILDAVEKLDAKLDQPHCEDPAKAAWMREIEARLKALEDR